jgi:hypothetical protein
LEEMSRLLEAYEQLVRRAALGTNAFLEGGDKLDLIEFVFGVKSSLAELFQCLVDRAL